MKLPVDYTKLQPYERKKVREEYIRVQKGICKHCKMPLDGPPDERVQALRINLSLFPPGFLDHPVHLHHNHDTGMTIGAIHARCNAVLWQYYGE
jgi:hypothetical protein